MMCFRCEHRAKFLDDLSSGNKHQHRPRCECGDIKSSKYACYMYQPCMPLVTEKLNKEDLRPEHGGYFRCRMAVSRIANKDDVKAVARYLTSEQNIVVYELRGSDD